MSAPAGLSGSAGGPAEFYYKKNLFYRNVPI